MPRTITTENPGVEVRRYLRHWANVAHLEAAIQERLPGIATDRRRRKATDAAASVAQAIELLETAAVSSLLTKPLPLFYAAEALAKAVCISTDAALDGSSFGAHGLRGDRSRRYAIRTLECTTRQPGPDVWSRLVASAALDYVTTEQYINGDGQIEDVPLPVPNPPAQDSTLVLSELLRHLPELAEDVQSAGWGHPYVVHARGLSINTQAPQAGLTHCLVAISLRHAHIAAAGQMIIDQNSPRGLCRGWTQRRDVFDVLDYQATAPTFAEISMPPRRLDIFGETYMDFSNHRARLAELPTYYAALFILSDAVRYQGQWRKLLDDHPAEAVLIDRFLDIAVRKLPNLALNHLAGHVHLFKVGS